MAAARLTWIDDPGTPLPPASQALGPDTEAPGLVAAGGDVTPARLEEAYRLGIFPWYSAGQPVLWWSLDPRMVLPVAEFRLTQSLKKTLRRFVRTPGCDIRIDSAFEAVIAACAGTPRAGQDGTWIVPEMQAAYTAWHRAGRAHSVETWIDGELVGGLYGVGIGRMFYGESMFAHRTDASKIALCALVCFARSHGITLHRLPAEHRSTWRRSARARSRAMPSWPTWRGPRPSPTSAIGPMMLRCGRSCCPADGHASGATPA